MKIKIYLVHCLSDQAVRRTAQTWPWVGFIHALGPKFSPMKWVGLGLVARN